MRLGNKKSRNAGPRPVRMFFATDVHGSEQCFRKFLNAGTFYDVDHLILGGDMTGKVLVPITREPSGCSCEFDGRTYVRLGKTETHDLCQRIRASGQYPFVGTPDDVQALEDPAILDSTFRRLVYEVVADWVQLAEERLRGTHRRCYMAPGNDDFFEIDEALRGSSVVEFAEGRCIAVDERHEMITTGFSNPTPWLTERELPEPDLRAKLEEMVQHVSDVSQLICVLHAPPFASEIDAAAELEEVDDELAIRGGASGLRKVPVGSTAVRGFIEDHQPLLGLHGHVHEAKGAARIGRTLCINPGSEYTDGALAGAIIELFPDDVRHQLVAG